MLRMQSEADLLKLAVPLLVPEDSPLRNPPASMDARQKVALDALRYSLDATFLCWQRVLQNIVRVVHAREADEKVGEPIAFAMADAWAMVDNLWRIHQVVNRMPQLKKPAELKAHLRALSEVEDFRHTLQHIEEKFQTFADAEVPLWGTLSWCVTPDGPFTGTIKMYAVLPGALRNKVIYPLVNPAGRMIERPIGLVTLSACGKELDLSTCARRIRAISEGFDKGIRQAVGNAPGGGADAIVSADYVMHGTRDSAEP